MALGRATNAAVARQVPDTVEAEGDARRREAAPGTSQRRFDSGMTGPNHHDIKSVQLKSILPLVTSKGPAKGTGVARRAQEES
jgi:hypothetical protein